MLCVGLGMGKVLRIGDKDVFGPEVHAACKPGEDNAHAWEILVTSAVQEAAQALPHVTFTPLEVIPSGASGACKMHYVL